MLKKDPRIQEALSRCYLSMRSTCKMFFPERYSRPFCSDYDKIFAALDDDSIRQVVIAAPRGYGKSTTATVAYPLKKILFREKKFIVPISCTATQAEMRGEDLKYELLENHIVNDLFGPMKSDRFAKEMWVTATGTAVMPRGAGQQIRGILYRGFRPDLIIGDDLENAENVINEEQRKKLKEWFFADVMNSVDRSRKDWKIVVIGTVLHEDSLLVNLLEDPNWYSIRLELCDDMYRSNWPEFLTDAEVKDLAESYAKQGLLHVFFMEYRNMVITSDAAFKQQYFKYYDEAKEDLTSNRAVETVVIMDPARTTESSSAKTAIVGVGINSKTGAIYVRDVINDRLHPDEQLDEAFAMCNRLNSHVLGVEVTGLNEFITYPIKNAIIQRALPIELVELKARGGRNAESKLARIRALIPFYRRGLVYHNPTCCGPLEAQLMSYPRSKYLDVMDVFSYIVEMLELGERYTQGEMPADDEYEDLIDDDYGMEPIKNWRVA